MGHMQHDKTVMIPKLVSSLSCDIKQVSSSDGAIGKYGSFNSSSSIIVCHWWTYLYEINSFIAYCNECTVY